VPGVRPRLGGDVEHITKSLTAMVLAVVAALLFVLGAAFSVAAFASLASVTASTSLGLAHAADWLRFTAGLMALAGVCAAGWELVLRGAWGGVWEAAAGALGILLITIGLLIAAVSPAARPAANVVGGVGIGVWAVLLASRAARRSLDEERARQQAMHPEHQAALWLVAAGGLVLLAAGYSLTPGLTRQSVGVTAGILQAAGVAILMAAIASAPALRRLMTRTVPAVLAGLTLLTAAFAAFAVVSGLFFGPVLQLGGLRIGYPVATGLQLLAAGVLGYAAWERVRELAVPRTS
jgi:hypothetical protein